MIINQLIFGGGRVSFCTFYKTQMHNLIALKQSQFVNCIHSFYYIKRILSKYLVTHV